MDVIVHIPEHLLARTDELVKKRVYATRCQLITKALRYYLDLKHPQKVTDDQYEEADRVFAEQVRHKEDDE